MKDIFDYTYWRIGRKLYHYKNLRKYLPDKMYLQNFFASCMGYYMDFNHPQTYNEKLQWLKLYDRKPIYTTLVDKFKVKSWVEKVSGDISTIRTIALYDDVSEINWSGLPVRFVIKCTHDSGSVIVVKNKYELNIEEVNAKLIKSLKQDYYILGREWPYKNVPHKILIEEYLGDNINDYKFFVFGGEVKCFKIDFDRAKNHKANYYDRNCQLLPFGKQFCPPDHKRKVSIPDNIQKMIELVEKMAKNIDCCFERIDLYNIDGNIYFGEITFYPGGGHSAFTDYKWDKLLGSWIKLKEADEV